MEVVISAKITGQHSRPQFPLPPLGSLTSWRKWRHLMVKRGTSKKRGKAMASYTWELAQDAAYQSHTSRLTEIWSLPRLAQGLNNNNNNNNNNLSKGTFSGKKHYWTQNMCFDYLYSFVWNITHSKKNLARYHKCTYVFLCSTLHYFHILMKVEFSGQIFEKKIPISNCLRIRAVDRRKDRRMTKLTAPFRIVWTHLKTKELVCGKRILIKCRVPKVVSDMSRS